MTNTWRSAIGRTKASAPMRYLFDAGILTMNTNALDYGCGRGRDAKHYDMDCYDPHFTKGMITDSRTDHPMMGLIDAPDNSYDLITCHYVLNVVDQDVRDVILRDIERLLKPGCSAYISVRADKHNDAAVHKGTNKEYQQYDVRLDLPLHRARSGSYRMYKLTKKLDGLAND